MPSKRDTYAEYVLRLRDAMHAAPHPEKPSNGCVLDSARHLARLATRHLRLCELDCSLPNPDVGPAWYQRLERVERSLRMWGDYHRVSVDFQRDPRGATVRVGGHPVPANGLPARALR